MEYVCFERHDVLFLELSADEVQGSVSGVCVRVCVCVCVFKCVECLFALSATSSNLSFAWGIFPSDVLMRTHRKRSLVGFGSGYVLIPLWKINQAKSL